MLSIKKISSVLAGSALLLGTMATSAFAGDITIQGNGAGSDNTVISKSGCSNTVIQSNNTSVVTLASVSASTGGNTASGNTGGDVSIDTGKADASLSVTVDGGSNEATSPDCCGCESSGDVLIKGNGKDSDNLVVEKDYQSNFVLQKNKTKVFTAAKVKASTGRNRANKNTGKNSLVEINTDNANSSVDVSVTAPSNLLNP